VLLPEKGIRDLKLFFHHKLKRITESYLGTGVYTRNFDLQNALNDGLTGASV